MPGPKISGVSVLSSARPIATANVITTNSEASKLDTDLILIE
jgi:hypothetical protein